MDLIQLRRDTVANWNSANPILALGEVGIVINTDSTVTNPVQFKVGNGQISWNTLPLQVAASISSITVNGRTVAGPSDDKVQDIKVTVSGSNTAGHLTSIAADGAIVDAGRDAASFVGTGSIAQTLGTDIAKVPSQKLLNDTSASVNTHIIAVSSSVGALVDQLVSGTLVPAYADDLKGTSTSRVEDTWTAYIRTTAGDLDIKSDETIQVESLAAVCDAASNSSFNMTSVRFNNFNALNPSQVLANAAITGNTVSSDSSYKVAYFRCVKGTWGSYGESTENNGYLFTDSSGNKVAPVAVKLCASIPTVGATISAVSTHAHNGYTYYLPASESYLCAQFANSVNLSTICAHIAWSNKDDDKYEAYVAGDTLALGTIISSRFGGNMNGIIQGAETVCDTITITGTTARSVKRCAKATLANLTWTMIAPVTESDAHRFEATISNIKADGLYQIPANLIISGNFILENQKLIFESNTIDTVNALTTALGAHTVVYETATESTYTDTLSNAANLHGHDMGTEEIVGATNLNFKIVTAYVQGLKDYLRGLPAELRVYNKVIAHTFNSLNGELRSLKEIVKTLQSYIHDYMVAGKPVFTEGSGSPVIVPDTVWQFYMDNVANVGYVSMANTSSGDWKRITNV